MKKYYVYTLAYPDGKVFYVGKGSKSRILNHEADAKNHNRIRSYNNARSMIIRQIWSQGSEVLKRKVAIFDSEDEAFTFEAELIKSIGRENLVNIDDGGKQGGARKGAGRPRKVRYLKMLFDSRDGRYHGVLPNGDEIIVDGDVFAETEQQARKDGSQEDLHSPLVRENNQDGDSVQVLKK